MDFWNPIDIQSNELAIQSKSIVSSVHYANIKCTYAISNISRQTNPFSVLSMCMFHSIYGHLMACMETIKKWLVTTTFILYDITQEHREMLFSTIKLIWYMLKLSTVE